MKIEALAPVLQYPWGGHHFFALPVSEFKGRMIPGESLWGKEVTNLLERIALACDDRTRVTLVEEFLLTQLRAGHKEEVEPYLRFIWMKRGQVTVRELAEEFGSSERQLERRFSSAVGASPKQMARITRFLNACRVLKEVGFGRSAEVALSCGYYDQAHFIRDFKSFSGLTPGDFLDRPSVSFLDMD